MAKWRKILWPLVPLYGIGISLRNKLFDAGLLESQKFDVPIITIGNISTGGTGKTPATEFILGRLYQYTLGFVSRGYGRKTKGLRIISPGDNPMDIGDEPWQIINKYPEIKGAVAEKRAEGILALLEKNPLDLIVLDDAFQHRHVKADLSILLTTWDDPYFKDQLLPAGNLREGYSAIKRAQIIIITKCPATITKDQSTAFIKKLKSTGQKIFFSTLEYGPLQNGNGDPLPQTQKKLNLLTGIANPSALVRKIKEGYELNKHWKYADHHRFTSTEIAELESSELPIITTEKDWARLRPLISSQLSKRIYPWPIQMKILFDQEPEFMNNVRKVLE